MKKKGSVLAIIWILILFSSSITTAQMGRGMGPGMGGMHGGCDSYLDLLGDLDLSDKQTEKLNKLKNSYRKEQIKLKAEMKIAYIEFRESLSGDSADMKTVEKIVKKIADLKSKLLMNSAQASTNARSILTKKQREKIKKLARERRSECRMYGGSGMMRGPHWSND
ncbi:MAG: Spy/CpxP family protein refolding chaperone [Deltaproteobacteria bacterium]|nr:Spy/CpxP family protein refolding chaperone [Deltaproteobacteria bacterium]